MRRRWQEQLVGKVELVKAKRPKSRRSWRSLRVDKVELDKAKPVKARGQHGKARIEDVPISNIAVLSCSSGQSGLQDPPHLHRLHLLHRHLPSHLPSTSRTGARRGASTGRTREEPLAVRTPAREAGAVPIHNIAVLGPPAKARLAW